MGQGRAFPLGASQLDSLETLRIDSTPCSRPAGAGGPWPGRRCFGGLSEHQAPAPLTGAQSRGIPETCAEDLLGAGHWDAVVNGTDLPLRPCN